MTRPRRLSSPLVLTIFIGPAALIAATAFYWVQSTASDPLANVEICSSAFAAPAPAATPENIVRLDDPAMVTLASATPPATIDVAAFGQVAPDPSAAQDINASISGQIVEMLVRPGSRVKAGEEVAIVYSPDFIFTQRSYLALLANDERLEVLRGEGNLPNFLKDAKDNLKWWGMSEQAINELTDRKVVVERLPILAPSDGVVTEVLVRPGDVIDAGDRTMQRFIVLGRPIARMIAAGPQLLEVSLFPDVATRVEPGATRVTFASAAGAPIEAAVSYVSPAVDPVNQMTRAVVRLPASERSRPIGEPVAAQLFLPRAEGVWISAETVLRQGLKPVAFVQKRTGEFERRSLEVLENVSGWVRVANVDASERLAQNGKTLLEGAYRRRGGDKDDAGHHH